MSSIRKNVVYMTLGMVRKAVALLIVAQDFMPKAKRFGALVWGQSGIGKNGVTDGIADNFTEKTGVQWGHIDCNVSSMTPEDLTGLPTIENGRTVYHPQYVLDTNSKGIFRVDELDRPAYFQNLIAVAKFAIDRTVETPLPLGWFVLGLANGGSECHTQELTEHLKGRFCHLYVSTQGSKAKGETADYYETRQTSAAIRKLASVEPVETRDEFEEHAVYNSRSLEYADAILKAYETLKAQGADFSDVLLPCLAGAIGKAMALELLKLHELADLPTLDEVCRNPHGTDIPDDTSLRHKYVSALVHEAQEDCHKATALMPYLVRLPNEVARYAIETLSTACPDVVKSAAYTTWANR
jgi:MoxR-like ATPase